MKKVASLIGLVLFAITANAAILRVPSEYPTIQAGINAAVNGDTVLVADGIYFGYNNKNLDFFGKAITVRSENGPPNCIIDCQNDGQGFYFHNSETSNSILDGFTIRNGYAYASYPRNRGGGIVCYFSSPLISNCVITQNSALLDGGGIYCDGSSPMVESCTISENQAIDYGGGVCCRDNSEPTFTNCTISGNSAYEGGGAYCHGSVLTFTNCVVVNNSVNGDGGGIYSTSGSCFVISNCSIMNNAGYYGGGIHCNSTTSSSLTGCLISGNSAEYGAGLYYWHTVLLADITNCVITNNIANRAGGGICCWLSSPTINNCIVSNNEARIDGGGLSLYHTSSTITNCTVVENSAAEFGGGMHCNIEAIPTIVNCILWDNSAIVSGDSMYVFGPEMPTVIHSDVQDGWNGEGNIDADPLFEPGPFGNCYLSQTDSGQATNSPCYNTGNTSSENICFNTPTGSVCLDTLSTRTDGMPDEEIVDMGYHYPSVVQTIPAMTPLGLGLLLLGMGLLLYYRW